MTDEIAALVLRNNYLQSQAISTLELQSARRLTELQSLVRSMERSGELNRAIEFLPDDEGFTERRKLSLGLTRPELATLLSYSKIVLNNQLIESDVPEDPYLSAELERYFPEPMRKRFGKAIRHHRLRREIIVTATTNSLVNRMGPSFVLRAQDDTGASPGQVARAYSIAREVFDVRRCWTDIEALDNHIPCSTQYAMMYETSRLLRHCSYWLLNHRRHDLAVDRAVKEFRPGIAQLMLAIGDVLSGAYRGQYTAARESYVKVGVPAPLAGRIAGLQAASSAFDIVEIARSARNSVLDAARIHFTLGSRIGLDWLVTQIEQLGVDGSWQAVARTGLRDAAQQIHRRLSAQVLATRVRGNIDARVSSWMSTQGLALETWRRIFADMRASASSDFATLSVGVDAVRRLTT